MAILMVVALLLSGVIYAIFSNEVAGRLTNFSSRLVENPDLRTRQQIRLYQTEEAKEAEQSIVSFLVILNISILIMGGFVSYGLASSTISSVEAAHKAQARFTSDASHELRTPLAAIKSEIEAVLYSTKHSKKELEDTLGSVHEEIDKMSDLTAMLLDLSRVNTLVFDTSPVEVNHAVQTVVDRLNQPDRIVYTPSNPIYIKGNELALETVFNILIENALKYSPAKSPVKITVKQSGGRVYVSVTNTGSGIAKADIPHIFESFYRGNTINIKQTKGHGMGLPLAKEIVEHHGGRIDVKSTTGKKTIFTVVLPKNTRPLSLN